MKLNTKLRSLSCATVCALLLVSAVSVSLGGQLTATLSGPLLGYVFNAPEGTLRPIRGILGSATVGNPVELDLAISQALTLDARHFVVSTDANPELLALNLEANPSSTAISGAPANSSHAVAGLRGKSAAFHYADAQQVLIVTGLPQKPAVSRRVDLSRVGKPLTQMAVSDDGSMLVFAVDEGRSEALYIWTESSGSARFLTAAVSIAGVAITGNGAAIVADRGANEVFAIWDAGGPAVRQLLAGIKESVSNPAGVAVSADSRIYIPNAGVNTITVLDSGGRFLKTHHCSCSVTGVYPLRDSVFRLTDRIDQSIYLLDASSAADRILFVPPAID